MGTEGKQLNLDLFDVGMTLRAFRDSRYQSTAFAVAELIDNSVDAEATFVEVLFVERPQVVITNEVLRVSEIAVADNGYGMTGETLVTALRFGGRGPDSDVPGIRGKYGVGLPTSSLSQCRRVDVWSWQNAVTSAVHCYLDVDEIEAGDGQIPAYDHRPIPEEWLRVMDESVSTSDSGTLVLWSNLDQVNEKRAGTVVRHMEQEVGRVYRHFLARGTTGIKMSLFDHLMEQATDRREIKPNDPLYLMRHSSTPEPWDSEPMFEKWGAGGGQAYRVPWEGKEYTVEVRYSKAREEVLQPTSTGQSAGSTEYGRHAGRNTGISVVREGRELVKVAPMVGRHDERSRWWGCEISFDSALDGLFGVDHNKQMASHLTSIAEGFADSDRLSYAIADEAGEDSPWMPLYQIVKDIRDNTAAMRREVERTLKQRGTQTPDGKETKTPTSMSVGVATKGNRRVEEEGEERPTSTDRDRERMGDESKAQEHKRELESRGYDEEAAERLAQVMVERGDRYAFVSDSVPGSHMFSVKSRAGVIWVTLNIDHPAYDLLRELEESLADLEESSSLSNACVALRLLLLSWASAEDQYHDSVQRMRVQNVAGTWGRYAATFFDVERAELGD